jgi:hypothetical protein
MNIQDNLPELLLKITSIITTNKTNEKITWNTCHPLAEAQYPGAENLFLTMLNGNNPSWKVIALQMLGFHYKMDPITLNMVKSFIVHDPNEEVRSTAIYVLANQSKNEEIFLLESMSKDTSKLVREDAFLMILGLSGLSTKKRIDIKDQIDNGKIGITVEELRRILKENNLENKLG